MIKVVIADEQTLFQEGLQAILKQSGLCEVVGVYKTSGDVLDALIEETVEADVILLNIHSAGEFVNDIKSMKTNFPSIGVLTLIDENQIELTMNLLHAGCHGVLLKKHTYEKLVEAVRNVYEGDYVIAGPLAKMLVQHVRSVSFRHYMGNRLGMEGYRFTSRELDVMQLMIKNYDNKRIAETLQLTHGTVKSYVSGIYLKLGIHDRNAVIAYLDKLVN